MESMSQIIAAMLSSSGSPQVTPMGGAPGGGGGMPGIAQGGGGMSAGRRPQRQGTPPNISALDVPEMGSQMQEAPQQSGMDAGNTNPMTGGGMPDDGGTFPDPDQLLKTYIEAQQDVQRIKLGTDTVAGRWQSRKDLPEAMEKVAWAKKNIDDYQQAKAAQENKANATQVLQTATSIVGSEQGQQMADFAFKNPDQFPMIMESLLKTAEAQRAEAAVIDKEFNTEDKNSAEMMNALVNAYPDTDTELLSSLVQTDSSYTELTNWLDKERVRTTEDQASGFNERIVQADAIAEADNTIKQINKTMEYAEGFGSTGLLGSMLKGIPATDAYKTWGSVDTQKAKNAFLELMRMRQASTTGGALGNVSNREIELLYSAFTALDPGMGEEAFTSNLTDVLQRFERMKYMLENEKQFEADGVSAADMYNRANNHVNTKIARQFGGKQLEALQRLQDNPETIGDFTAGFGWTPVGYQ